MSEPKPTRRSVLYLVDPASGRLYPVKLTLTTENVALLPVSLEKDAVGLATEPTLSAVNAKVQSILLDEYGRVYVQNPPNLDVKLSDVLGFGTQAKRSLSDVYSAVSDVSASIGDLKTRSLDESGLRCYTVTVDDLFAVPSGESWYVKNLYITASGVLYVDGEVKLVG
jgi:hypothetical protein